MLILSNEFRAAKPVTICSVPLIGVVCSAARNGTWQESQTDKAVRQSGMAVWTVLRLSSCRKSVLQSSKIASLQNLHTSAFE